MGGLEQICGLPIQSPRRFVSDATCFAWQPTFHVPLLEGLARTKNSYWKTFTIDRASTFATPTEFRPSGNPQNGFSNGSTRPSARIIGRGRVVERRRCADNVAVGFDFQWAARESADRRASKREVPAFDPNRTQLNRSQGFLPAAPKSLEDAGLTETEVEDLILKFLLRRGVQSGRGIAEQLRLPFGTLQAIFQAMKSSQRIVIARNASVSDYEYSITNKGIEAAKQCNERSTYFGSAPVPFADYVAAVSAQSMTRSRITLPQVEAALADLLCRQRSA